MQQSYVSMREAASTLGVSQLRVRELIRKGTLAAEKVVDDAGERWSIAVESMQEYVQRRGRSNNQHDVPALIDSLERRLRVLASELGSMQELLAHLKSAAAKQVRPQAPAEPSTPMDAQAEAEEPPPPVKTKTSKTPAKPKPKPKPKVKPDGSLAEGGTLADALKSAGVDAEKPKRKPPAKKAATTTKKKV